MIRMDHQRITTKFATGTGKFRYSEEDQVGQEQTAETQSRRTYKDCLQQIRMESESVCMRQHDGMKVKSQVDALRRNRKANIKTTKVTVKQNLNDILEVSKAEIFTFSYARKLYTALCVIEADC